MVDVAKIECNGYFLTKFIQENILKVEVPIAKIWNGIEFCSVTRLDFVHRPMMDEEEYAEHAVKGR